MNTQWALYNEVNKDNNIKYERYSCPDPTGNNTEGPWYPTKNICPCDSSLSNKTGRGFVTCPLGISEKQPFFNINKTDNGPSYGQNVGSMYSEKQFSPPQMMPRPATRIGYEWRSGN